MQANQFRAEDFVEGKLTFKDVIAVLFSAKWCLFCRTFTPIFESSVRDARIEGGYVDLSDLSNPLWEIFKIRALPTLMLFDGGVPVLRKDAQLARGLSEKDLKDIVDAAERRMLGKG